MNEEKYVAAIEISSSKIIAVIGKMRPGGQLDIIASEQEKGGDGVRYGVIQNLEEASMRINRIVNILERKPAVAPRKISGMFVGLSGRSLRSIPTKVSINLPEDSEITDEILSRLLTQARNTAIDSSLEVVDAVPRAYRVGRSETLSPKGMVGDSISADFDIIVCRPDLKRNLIRTIQDKLKIDIRGVVVSPLAAGQLILSAEQKRLGCMLVDMGGETTTVTIYKNGHLVYFATLPLGGRHITRDITSLNVLEERAEEIKITSGNAIPRETASSINYHGVRDTDVSNLIVARAEETVINILKQINYAGLKDSDLPGGIILIGGASKLNGMLDLIASKSGLPVNRGTLPQYVHLEDLKISSTDIIEVASVLYAGASSAPDTNCLEMPRPQGVPVTGEKNEDEEEEYVDEPEPRRPPKKPSWFTRFMGKAGDSVSGFFGGNEDDSDPLD